jgi:drug/metabolite transporter (DMT)-like permease
MTSSDPLRGAALIVFSMATLTGLTACAKLLSRAGVHPFEVVFFRNLFAAIVFSPLLFYRGRQLFDIRQLSMYGWRCLVGLISMLCWFYALSMIPIGEVTAITYLTPLFGTLGAIFFLGEKVRARRWTALAVGFMGALIILRPGVSPLGIGQFAALASTITGGLSVVLVKQLTGRDDPNKIVFLTHLFLAPMSLIPALFVWQWPSPTLFPLLLGMGVFATIGHATLVRGYSMMDASLGLTFEFAKLPFATLLAYVLFGETIDRWTWLGAFIIIGSATYIANREAKVRAEAIRQAAPTVAAAPSLDLAAPKIQGSGSNVVQLSVARDATADLRSPKTSPAVKAAAARKRAAKRHRRARQRR